MKLEKRTSDSDSSVLVALCILGNCVLAQTMLSRGVSIDQPIAIDSQEFGQSKITSLECAVFFGHRNLVRILLEANQDKSWIKRRGESCLRFALRHEDDQLLQILFDHMPEDCAAISPTIFTQASLKKALKNKEYKMAGILLANVPSYHDDNTLVKAILETALENRDRTAVRVILKDARRPKHGAPALLDGHRKLPVWLKNDLETLEILLNGKALSMTHSGDLLLSQAIQMENISMLEVLLQKRDVATVADWTDPSGTPLALAVEKRNAAMVKMLLKDAIGTGPITRALETAIAIRWKKGVELLLSYRKNPFVGEKLLRELFLEILDNPESHNPEIIELLLSKCPSILDAALVNAILYARPKEVKLVLKYEPDINGPIRRGKDV